MFYSVQHQRQKLLAVRMNESQMIQHPASVDAYIRHGWSLVPIPPGSKGPRQTGWNRKENALRSQSNLPLGYGIGLAHAYSGTMALDVDDWQRATFELMLHSIDLNALYTAHDAVIIDSGRQGHGKLIYAMPPGKVLPSKKLTDTDTQGANYNYLDFRCATADGLTVQDVLPPSIHPDTRQPYRWAGYGNWTRLPQIPSHLLDFWQNLVDKDKQATVPSGDTMPTSWDEIQRALGFIDPDCDRKQWIDIGAALHLAGTQLNQLDTALHTWNQWSQGSHKYPGERDILVQWRAFRSDKTSLVKLGTIFMLAKKGGYVRPSPDVSALFKTRVAMAPQHLTGVMRPMSPQMDLDAWPEVLATRAKEVSESIGCDPLVPLFAGLGAICGAVDARTRLELMPGYQVPPVLWLMTIGDPADKKSPGSNPMLEPLRTIEQEDYPRFKSELLDWEAKEAMYSASKKSFLEWAASTDAMLDTDGAPPVSDLPPQPVPLRLTVSDVTSQKLVRQCADRPRGLLCHLDEMAGWINKLTDRKSGEDRSAWVVCYESKPYDMDRVGAGSIHCDNLAVSIYGNIQPHIFKTSVQALTSDGLLQRFIPAILDSNKTKRGNPIPDYLTNKAAWENTLRMIYALPAMTYRLSPAAFALFREFQLWYEDKKHDERLNRSSPDYMTAFGKLEGTAGRLILLCHVVESPFSTEVSVDLVERVIFIIRTYVVPALRFALCEVGDLQKDSFETWITDYVIMRSGEVSTLSVADIRGSARRQLEGRHVTLKNQIIIDAMVEMEKANWVHPVEYEPAKGHVVWAINPTLATVHEDHRNQVMKARQRLLDDMYVDGPKFEKFKGRKFVYGYTTDLDGN